MKKLFTLLILFFLWVGSSWATVSTYTFAGSSGTFTPIAGGTVLGTGTIDDNVFNANNIGFLFLYNGAYHSQFSVNANGWLCMGAAALSSYNPISTGTSNNVISAIGRDLQGLATGEISYKVLGISPNRTLVVQWLHYSKYGTTGAGDDWNFQIRLNETTNTVDIVYGTFTVNATSTTVEVGLRGASTADFNNRTTTTNWAITTAGILNTDACTLSNTVFPVSGQTFTYTPPVLPTPADPITMTFTGITGGTMTVNWVDNSINETGFSLIRALDAGFTTGVVVINVASTTSATTGTAYNSGSITGLYPGTTYYFKVMAVNDGGGSPGLTGSQATSPVATITSSAIGGLWNDPATWVGGVLPAVYDNVTIASGSTVVVNQSIIVLDLTLDGTLQWITTTVPSSTVNTLQVQNMTISATGKLYAHGAVANGATVKTTGNFTNNGWANFAAPGALLYFIGTIGTQTLGGSGTFLADMLGRGMIQQLFFTSLAACDISTTQNLVTGNLAHTAGSLNTNGKLSIDNTAICFGGLINRSIATVTVNVMGSGYTAAPTVAFTAAPAGGTTATGVANYDAATGTIRSITITNAGDGYRVAPTFIFTGGGGGTGLAAVAALYQNLNIGFVAQSQKSAIASITGGITINSSQGLGSAFVTFGGTGYTSAPTVGFTLPIGFNNLVTAGGSGYTSAPTVTFSGGGGVTQATGTAVVCRGQVVSVVITAGGTGYTSVPAIALTGGGYTTIATAAVPVAMLPTAIANIDAALGMVTSFTVTNPGYGYILTFPAIVLTGGGFTTAATGPIGRHGVYNLIYNYFSPATSNAIHTESAVIPANRRIHALTLANATGFGASFTGNITLYALAPLPTFTGNLNMGGNNLTFEHPSYLGTAGSTTAYVSNGMITYKLLGSTSAQTRPFPFNSYDGTSGFFNNLLSMGSATTVASEGSTITTITGSYAGAPTGANMIGTRTLRLQTFGGLYGNLPTLRLTWNSIDNLFALANLLYISQATGTAGPWTIRSAASGTGYINPAGGNRTTATTVVGPIAITGDDYFGWEYDAPACPPPYAGTTTNITTTTADLNWTNGGAETLWNVKYGAPGFDPLTAGTLISGIAAHPYTLNPPLIPGTAYAWYVQADCGGGSTSTWYGPYTFTTLCNIIASFPWSENFDAMPAIGNNILPNCWLATSTSGTPWYSGNAASNTYNDPCSTPNYVYVYYSPSGVTKYLITPGFTLTAATSYDFKFKWVGDGYAGWTGDVMVNTVQSGTGATALGSSFVIAGTTTTTTCTLATRSFMPATNGTYYFMVRVSNTVSPYYLGFDDFSLDLTPPDPAITVAPNTLAFGYVPSGGTSVEKTYTLSGIYLLPAIGNITVTPPPNFEVSLTTGGPYSSTPITVGYTGGTLAATTIFVVFKPIAPSTYYTGNIANWGGGAVTQNVAVTGNSDLFASYCASGAAYIYDEEIYSVTVNGATNAYDCFTVAPGAGSILNRYSNFFPLGPLTAIQQGAAINFSVEENECDGASYYSFGTAIWIDYNHDGDFDDAGETVFKENSTLVGPRNVVGSFVVPVGATLGLTAMRITVAEGYSGASLTPCLAYNYGETEDYQVNITQGFFGNLQGYVYEQPACTTPISGATVSNGTFTTTTDGTGFYQFLNLSVGNYNFTASQTGYVNQTITGISITLGGTTTQNFCLDFYLAPPSNLQAVVYGALMNNVHLTWSAPGSLPPEQWIQWDDGTYYNAIGTAGVVDFMVASRWPVADIAPYGGMYLKKIQFWPYESSTVCTYTIKVWTGVSPPTEVYSYTIPAASIITNAWNTYTFPGGSGIPITGTQEFWFGYEANTISGYPAGCDNGPQIEGKGNMIYWSGAWTTLYILAPTLTYNWLIHGWLAQTALLAPQQLIPMEQGQQPIPIDNVGTLMAASNQSNQEQTPSDRLPAGQTAIHEVTPPSLMAPLAPAAGNNSFDELTPGGTMLAPLIFPSLTGYNVYRNSIEIADNWLASPYDDLTLPKGHYCYQVSAKYDNGGESAKIGPVCVDIYTCFPPTNVHIDGATTTTTTAHASWTASTITPNPEWIFEYGPAGFAHGAGIGGPQYIDNPFITLGTGTLPALTPGTEYDFYVRTLCVPGDSSAWVKKTFRTHYFDCPTGATAELEVCGTDANGGCNMTVPAFEPLACGETKCGTAYYNGTNRDTDWYLFTLTQTTDVTWTGKAEFSSLFGIIAAPCPASAFIVSATGAPGATVSVTTTLAAGTYYAWAGPQFAEIVKCDSLCKYYATLTCNTCISPSALTATNMTTTTADLGWTPGSTETAWEYVIGLSPLPVPTGAGIPTNTNPTHVTGLSGSTTYCYYVRSSCGGGNYSAWVGPYCFSTLCEPSTLPFAESFDGVTFAPTCWTNVNTAGPGTPGTWDRQTAGIYPTCTPHSGAGMARYNSYNYGAGTTGILVTPQITIPGDQYQVRFWMYRDNGYLTTADLVNVYYSTNPSTTGATLLGTVNRSYSLSPVEAAANQWYEYGFNMPTGTSGNAYFVFEAVSQYGNSMFLDDVSLFALVPLTKTLNLKLYLEGLCGPGFTGLMNQAMENNAPPPGIPHFGAGIADQVTVELHNALSPYGSAYTYTNVNLNTDGTLAITTIPGTITGSYYVVIKHRNSIETWSNLPVPFGGASPISYDFTTALTQAYHDASPSPAMKLVGSWYAFWGGDVNQDGIVDGTDLSDVDNANTVILVGYNPQDANGDGIVDASDLSMVDNNNTAIRHVQKP